MVSLYSFCPTGMGDLHESNQEMDLSMLQKMKILQAAAAATGALCTLWLQVLDTDL